MSHSRRRPWARKTWTSLHPNSSLPLRIWPLILRVWIIWETCQSFTEDGDSFLHATGEIIMERHFKSIDSSNFNNLVSTNTSGAHSSSTSNFFEEETSMKEAGNINIEVKDSDNLTSSEAAAVNEGGEFKQKSSVHQSYDFSNNPAEFSKDENERPDEFTHPNGSNKNAKNSKAKYSNSSSQYINTRDKTVEYSAEELEAGIENRKNIVTKKWIWKQVKSTTETSNMELTTTKPDDTSTTPKDDTKTAAASSSEESTKTTRATTKKPAKTKSTTKKTATTSVQLKKSTKTTTVKPKTTKRTTFTRIPTRKPTKSIANNEEDEYGHNHGINNRGMSMDSSHAAKNPNGADSSESTMTSTFASSKPTTKKPTLTTAFVTFDLTTEKVGHSEISLEFIVSFPFNKSNTSSTVTNTSSNSANPISSKSETSEPTCSISYKVNERPYSFEYEKANDNPYTKQYGNSGHDIWNGYSINNHNLNFNYNYYYLENDITIQQFLSQRDQSTKDSSDSQCYTDLIESRLCYDLEEDENAKCPHFRNLMRHVPAPPPASSLSLDSDSGCPASPGVNPKPKNCLSDGDCPKESYCCLSMCEGVTRCYSPKMDKFVQEVNRHNVTVALAVSDHKSVGDNRSQAQQPKESQNRTNSSQTQTKDELAAKDAGGWPHSGSISRGMSMDLPDADKNTEDDDNHGEDEISTTSDPTEITSSTTADAETSRSSSADGPTSETSTTEPTKKLRRRRRRNGTKRGRVVTFMNGSKIRELSISGHAGARYVTHFVSFSSTSAPITFVAIETQTHHLNTKPKFESFGESVDFMEGKSLNDQGLGKKDDFSMDKPRAPSKIIVDDGDKESPGPPSTNNQDDDLPDENFWQTTNTNYHKRRRKNGTANSHRYNKTGTRVRSRLRPGKSKFPINILDGITTTQLDAHDRGRGPGRKMSIFGHAEGGGGEQAERMTDEEFNNKHGFTTGRGRLQKKQQNREHPRKRLRPPAPPPPPTLLPPPVKEFENSYFANVHKMLNLDQGISHVQEKIQSLTQNLIGVGGRKQTSSNGRPGSNNNRQSQTQRQNNNGQSKNRPLNRNNNNNKNRRRKPPRQPTLMNRAIGGNSDPFTSLFSRRKFGSRTRTRPQITDFNNNHNNNDGNSNYNEDEYDGAGN